ncbi:MAG: hypothetical protein JNN07_06710 [Verrucomicrobiales bacterium]|nr:hypothetical protein [Verrucomicrobiales bacterium]
MGIVRFLWRLTGWVGVLGLPVAGWAALVAPLPSSRFAVRQQAGGWSLVTPDSNPFFSLGVCVLSSGPNREQFDPENPAYAFWQHYSSPERWADDTLSRLKSWRFTTVGGWGDLPILRTSKEQTLYLTPVLHMGSTAGAPWWDMWDARNIRRMESVARDQILPLKGDSRVMGYYSDNELGWWNATLWKMTLEQPRHSGQRQRLIALLREYYQEDWARLMADFTPENAQGWRELQRGGALFMKPGGRGIRPMRQFLGLLAHRYYGLMREIILRLDPGALYLGDRYQSFYYPEVAEACGRHVDVVSSNLNAAWNDGTFPRFQLETLRDITRKPILVSEFYMAARQNRSRNRNDHGIYPVVETQSERAAAAARTLNDLAQLPYVVGADWFQYADEPSHGRADGENFNFGLVDIHNRPYEELTEMFSRFDPAKARAEAARRRPDARTGVPMATEDPFARFVPTTALKHWDRERGFMPPVSERPVADLYLCWTTNAFYLGLYALDIVEEAYYRGASIPKEDRALWSVKVNGLSVKSRLGAGRQALVSVHEPPVRVECLSGLNLNVRNVAILEIPAALLGRGQLRSGDQVDLSVELLTHARAYRVEWRGAMILKD